MRIWRTLLLVLVVPVVSGCHTDMWVQKKIHKPYQPSEFFSDGMSSRPPVPNTVPVDSPHLDRELYTGIKGGTKVPIDIRAGSPVQTGIFRGEYVTQFPFSITREDLYRGRDQYDAFCSPCHGRVGDGNGMVALRGFNLRRKPASFHTDRLRTMPVGHFYDVITNGYGVMYGHASRIAVEDRWRIVAYIRALQLSRHAPASALPPEDLAALEKLLPEKGVEK